MDAAMIATIIALITLAGAVVLLCIGFRGVIKSLKEGSESTKIPKKILIRSTLFLAGSLVCVWICYCALHFKDYLDGVCTLSELITTHLFSVLKGYGWIAVIPWLLSFMRFSTRPNYQDTDKM